MPSSTPPFDPNELLFDAVCDLCDDFPEDSHEFLAAAFALAMAIGAPARETATA